MRNYHQLGALKVICDKNEDILKGFKEQYPYVDICLAVSDVLRRKDIEIGVSSQYSVLARDEEHRLSLQSRLKEAGIPTAIYYPKPLHLQTAFSYLNYKEGDFPVSEDCASRIFSLPMHPYLKAEDQERIAQVIGSRHT